ncbi:MAG: DMT family transporter [Promethearchaeota archaeon]|nr:MAG: DMT family transporter [Candidatus Lokiarchaeota archaeon]
MSEIIGFILTIDAIFTWALASLVYKWGLGKTEPKANIFFRLCCVSLSTFIIALFFGNILFLSNMDSTEIFLFILTSIISGLSVTIGDLFYYKSLKKIDASRAYPLTQLSLIFVYPFSFMIFQEVVTPSILLGGLLILSSVFILSSKDKSEKITLKRSIKDKLSEDLIIGVLLAIATAFFWAISYVSYNQARILTGDIFYSNFFRIIIAAMSIALLGLFQRDYYDGFKKENKKYLKYFFAIGIAGSLSLGLADALFIKAAEINGLVLTSTITANTPMVQQILSIILLKEKFRKRFLVAIGLIIMGNYIIIFL